MKRLRPSSRRLSGSSLIEILIATLVVGLVLTSIAFLMSLNVKSSSDAELRTQATVFAQQGVDLVRQQRVSLTWSSFIGSLSGSGCTNDTGLSFANILYKRSCSFSSGGGACTANTNTCRLTVIVCWPRPTGVCDSTSPNKVTVIQDFYNR